MDTYTFGDINKEKVLLIHPMFTSAEFFRSFIEKHKGDYYFIVPTLSGHSENSTFISTEQEENALNEFLKSNNISHLNLVVGFSLGGNIAFDYFCKNADKVDKVVVDSAPLFRFPQFIKNHFYRKYKKCLNRVKANKANAANELNKCFHGMGESQQYIAPLVTSDSLKGLIESCYNNNLVNLSVDAQRKIVFVYGTKDVAKLCLRKIKKYKASKLVILPNYNHCELFMNNSDEYWEKICKS